jgi:hypothetical protein
MIRVRLSGSNAFLAPDSSKKHASAAIGARKAASGTGLARALPVVCQREGTLPPGRWELRFHISNPSRESLAAAG